jgi:hypothetical protein
MQKNLRPSLVLRIHVLFIYAFELFVQALLGDGGFLKKPGVLENWGLIVLGPQANQLFIRFTRPRAQKCVLV